MTETQELDLAIAKREGIAVHLYVDGNVWVEESEENGWQSYIYSPSTDWAIGGPIIEREKITLAYLKVDGEIRWEARYFDNAGRFRAMEFGPTPLIAAMLCYKENT